MVRSICSRTRDLDQGYVCGRKPPTLELSRRQTAPCGGAGEIDHLDWAIRQLLVSRSILVDTCLRVIRSRTWNMMGTAATEVARELQHGAA
jgi:hypothetical protein